jgi:5-methylcytosine-specific restriction endonuclease McrA
MDTLTELKICSKCKELKSLNRFSKRLHSKDGLQAQCKECQKKYANDYRRNNPEKTKAIQQKYRSTNPEKIRANTKKWAMSNSIKIKTNAANYRAENKEKIKSSKQKYRSSNPDKVNASNRKWLAKNPEKNKNYANKRRTKKLNNGVFKITSKELKKLYLLPCIYCGSLDSIEMDHVIPISRGGRHSIGNIVPACRKCNASKSDKFLIEWKKL